MNYGVQKCIWTALGDVTANFIQATLVIFVIGSFFSENSTLLNAFKWIGVIYILYLAYDLYNSRPKDINSKTLLQKVYFLFLKMVFCCWNKSKGMDVLSINFSSIYRF